MMQSVHQSKNINNEKNKLKKELKTFFKSSGIHDLKYCLKICEDTGLESVEDLFENKNELGKYLLKPI